MQFNRIVASDSGKARSSSIIERNFLHDDDDGAAAVGEQETSASKRVTVEECVRVDLLYPPSIIIQWTLG